MAIPKDFRELLALLNAHEVDYLIVEGYALAFHGAPRYTGDLDILVNPSEENARRILVALEAFGFGSLEISIDDFRHSERIVQLGVPPVRVDLITSIDGVSWDDAWAGRATGEYDNIPLNFIGRREFIANKRASGKLKDLADIEALGEN